MTPSLEPSRCCYRSLEFLGVLLPIIIPDHVGMETQIFKLQTSVRVKTPNFFLRLKFERSKKSSVGCGGGSCRALARQDFFFDSRKGYKGNSCKFEYFFRVKDPDLRCVFNQHRFSFCSLKSRYQLAFGD